MSHTVRTKTSECRDNADKRRFVCKVMPACDETDKGCALFIDRKLKRLERDRLKLVSK